jgi:hypothetical protein
VNGRRTILHCKQRFDFRILVLFFLTLCGCGAPGEPQPPSPPIPAPITDLAAHQQGNGVRLVFTLPSRTTSGERLAERPAMEIFRGSLRPNGSPDNKSFKLVYTIPGALADAHTAEEKIQFTDPLPPDDLRTRPGTKYAYRVRTRASKKKDSADSNTVVAKVYPVAERITSLNARVTQDAIELSWPVPAPGGAQNADETLAGYHVYRGELETTALNPVSDDLSQAKWKSPPSLLAPVESNSYHDTLFDFGKTYAYQVRSVVIAEGNPVESDDSAPAIVTPRDTFPPAVPQNVVAAEIPSEDGVRVVDLSWSINVENDFAGYRVYRSETPDELGQPVPMELLLSPSYRDSTVQPGHRYWYAVTAVDRAGNESAPSEPAALDLTQPLP